MEPTREKETLRIGKTAKADLLGQPRQSAIPTSLKGINGDTMKLSMEKQFQHRVFCNNIKGIDLETAKQLLIDIHLLYLGQQVMFAELAKNDFDFSKVEQQHE